MKRIVLLLGFVAFCCVAKAYEEEVTFENEGIIFGGTLAMPDSVGKFPALVLVSGSGQQNRDSELFGFKSFKVISDSLVNIGFAVLRYDDRGIGGSVSGKSTLDTSTTYTFAYDALSAIRFLKSNKHIDAGNIGILGHSEGGLIADYLAAKFPNEIAFAILMAGPAVSPQKIVNYQIEYINKEKGVSQEVTDTALAYQNLIYRAIEEKKSKSDLIDILYRANLASFKDLPESTRKSVLDTGKYARFLALQSVKSVDAAWFREFVKFKPQEYTRKINCPTLALFGEKDQQVPVSLNLEPLKLAFAGRESLLTVKIIADANHLFRSAKTGSYDEYSQLEAKFAPGFIPAIIEFLKERKGK